MAQLFSPVAPQEPPLFATECKRLGWICARLPLRWTRSARRRRFLFLALAAPGFVAVFAAPLHRSLLLLVAGFLLFAAAVAFRRRTEAMFARAEAATVWPPTLKETIHHA